MSSLELFKICGIFLIILSHVVQTLCTDQLGIVGYNDYFLDLFTPTADYVRLILLFFRYTGIVGNAVFFMCSAWFFIDSSKTSYQKIWRMMLDILTISLIWLFTYLIASGFSSLDWHTILHSAFPTYFSNNWYLTVYIVFCLTYPLLNKLIGLLGKREHLLIALVLFFVCLVANFLVKFTIITNIGLWISIYFIVAYFKIYGKDFCDSTKANVILLIIGTVGGIGLILLTNLLGLYVSLSFLPNSIQHWMENCNPFVIAAVFASINLLRKWKIQSKVINYISGLSLLIYIIHENIIFRTYWRPWIWEWIYNNLGYKYILLWTILFALALFIASALISIIYKLTLEKLIFLIADKTWILIKKGTNGLLNFFSRKIT